LEILPISHATKALVQPHIKCSSGIFDLDQ